jgi:hypothetical protein
MGTVSKRFFVFLIAGAAQISGHPVLLCSSFARKCLVSRGGLAGRLMPCPKVAGAASALGRAKVGLSRSPGSTEGQDLWLLP